MKFLATAVLLLIVMININFGNCNNPSANQKVHFPDSNRFQNNPPRFQNNPRFQVSYFYPPVSPPDPIPNHRVSINSPNFSRPSPNLSLKRTNRLPTCKTTDDFSPCEEDEEYTIDVQNQLQAILENSPINNLIRDESYRSFLNDTDEHSVINDVPMTRFGVQLEESTACVGRETIIYPKRARTPQNDWAIVLNIDEVTQGVRVEKCIGKDLACDIGGGTVSTVESFCRQKYIIKRMLVLDQAGNAIAPEQVYMPSCCVCYIRRTQTDVKPRFGNGNSSIPAPTSIPVNPTNTHRQSSNNRQNFQQKSLNNGQTTSSNQGRVLQNRFGTPSQFTQRGLLTRNHQGNFPFLINGR